MQLTDAGINVAQQGEPERRAVLDNLLSGAADITDYTMGAVCYDVTAFCTYLQRGDSSGISPDQLVSLNGQDWLGVMQFDYGTPYTGGSIERGAAIGFRREDGYFHAAVATGGTEIRSVNGLLLGAGWSVPADLSVLGAPDEEGAFTYDGRKVQVRWI